MLKVQSFKITDAEGVNSILNSYPLAKGMHILVSDGEVMIPFEDGSPEPLAVRITTIKEQINTLEAQKEVIVQSQMTARDLLEAKKGHYDELKANIAEAEAKPNAKGETDTLKDMKDVEKQAAKAIYEDENRIMLNDKEIERMNINILTLKNRIEEISNEKA